MKILENENENCKEIIEDKNQELEKMNNLIDENDKLKQNINIFENQL